MFLTIGLSANVKGSAKTPSFDKLKIVSPEYR